MADDTPGRSQGLARRFAKDWLAPQWRWFLLGAVFSAVTAAAGYGYADTTRRAFDWLAAGDVRVLTLVPAVIVVLVIVRAFAMYGQTQSNNEGVQRAVVAVQQALFGKLMRGDFARLQTAASGEHVSRFANDMVLVREASLRVATNLAKSTLTILAALIFMFVTDWALALLLLVAYPIAFWPVVRLGERIRKTSRRAQEQAGGLTAFLSEAFQGARTVKAFRLEEQQEERAGRGFRERARLYMKILRAKAVVDPFLEVVGGIALAGLFAFAGWRAMNGEATAGELVGFITIIAIASPEVRALGTLSASLNEGLAAADRIYRELDARDAIADRDGAHALDAVRGKVAFEDVAFGYGEGAGVLNGMSFTAAAGQTVALVGPSGGGKSTVFNLLLRFYDPTAGAVRIDGHDVRDVTLASLRSNIALVSQEAFLFDGPIRENILFGRPGASEADMQAAAKAAACDFIAELSGGWGAQVGEGGRNLSGGQRQRVALARALLSEAPILLLDEATSALDADNEARVQQALAGLRGTKTVLVIAHRLATVRQADRILVVEGGRIVASGAHDELMRQGGLYAGFAASQLG